MTDLERAQEITQIADSVERRSELLIKTPSTGEASEVSYALLEIARALHYIAAYISDGKR
jgi:hypothetical protein